MVSEPDRGGAGLRPGPAFLPAALPAFPLPEGWLRGRWGRARAHDGAWRLVKAGFAVEGSAAAQSWSAGLGPPAKPTERLGRSVQVALPRLGAVDVPAA